MERIQTLLDRQPPGSVAGLPKELSALYGGDLQFAATSHPYVIANFASTLDGVVSYQIPGKSSGGEISGHNACDRFIMALLRASADAVMVGARTFHEAGASHLWTAESLYPEAAGLLANVRAAQSSRPLLVIVSGTGTLDLSRAVFRTPQIETLVITSRAGKHRMDAQCTDAQGPVKTRMLGGGLIAPEAIARLLYEEFGVRVLLHEGGPKLLGQFVKARLVDELFLTIAPQLAGRDSTAERPALIQNAVFMPDDAPWLKLLSVKNGGDHLFLRYGRSSARDDQHPSDTRDIKKNVGDLTG